MAATKWTPQVIAAEVVRKNAAGIERNYGKPVKPAPQLAVKAPSNPVSVTPKPVVTPISTPSPTPSLNPSSAPPTPGVTIPPKASWMGDNYQQVTGTDWYSTNSNNQNASKYYTDGRPVPTVDYNNQQTGLKFNGYANPEQFKSILEAGDALEQSKLMTSMINSGSLISNDSIYGKGPSTKVTPPTPGSASNLVLRPGMNTTPENLPLTAGTPIQGWGGVAPDVQTGGAPVKTDFASSGGSSGVNSAPTTQATTNFGTGALGNLLYLKKKYAEGVATGNKGLQNWAASQANQYYSQLNPEELARVKGFNSQQLEDYISKQNQGTPAVSPQTATEGDYTGADVQAEIDAQIRGLTSEIDTLKSGAMFGVNQNNAFLDEQIGKLRTAKNQNDLTIQETENRFGGVYSGGMRLGQAANLTSTNEAIGGISRDVAARNQQLIDQLGTQTSTIAANIADIQAKTPQIIRDRILEYQTKTAPLTGMFNGKPTMDAKDQEFSQGVTMSQLTGFLPNGQPTTDEQQRQLTNLWKVAAETGVIPNALADLYGIKRGTQTQEAYQFAQDLALKLDDNALAWDKFDLDKSNPGGGGGDKPQTAQNMRTYFDSMVERDSDGKITNKTALEAAIMEAPISDYEAYQLALLYGIPWQGPIPEKGN